MEKPGFALKNDSRREATVLLFRLVKVPYQVNVGAATERDKQRSDRIRTDGKPFVTAARKSSSDRP
jgi:hypothetical protein